MRLVFDFEKIMDKICKTCKKIIPAKKRNKVYCSQECRNKKGSGRVGTFKDLGITNTCEYCDQVIPIHKYSTSKYCSDFCRWSVANLKLYGLSAKDYKEMLKEQKHVCKVCENDCKLYVDHCHMSGKVRGLICQKCNSGIGFLGDSYDNVKRALEYLDSSR